MKRPARVPASNAVRMKSASNRIAKWYQKPRKARPPPESQYGALRAWVERERLALLRVEFFRPGASAASKTLEIAPGEVRERNGVLEPERMWVRQAGRSAATEVVFERIRSGAEIDAGVFAPSRLERSSEDLFALVERLRAEGAR